MNIKAVSFGALASASLLALCTSASALQAGEPARPIAVPDKTESVCAGQAPAGWIKVDDAWNPTTCGNPTTKTYNVWVIAQVTEKPIGSSMVACRGQAPAGWVIVDTSWNPTVCGHPTANQKNVMTIKRLS